MGICASIIRKQISTDPLLSAPAGWIDKINKLGYGEPLILEPKGEHLATIVWLHGLGDSGSSFLSLLRDLPLPNVKWILPTAPKRPVTANNGRLYNSWFDVVALEKDAPDDLDGLDISTAFVATLLSNEPPEVKLVVGGLSQGGATSLYLATRFATEIYSDGTPFHGKLDAVVSISGWLPCVKLLKNQVLENEDKKQLPLFLCHGTSDSMVKYELGEIAVNTLQTAGFNNLTFKTYIGVGHFIADAELADICKWLGMELGLTTQTFD